MRDEFKNQIKELLAKRVCFRCSNPKCRQATSGPQGHPTKVINVGVAAHITAASPDGPRYNPSLTHKYRASSENGIWLCQTCGKLVDDDKLMYTVEILKQWKTLAEAASLRELENRQQPVTSDKVFLRLERLMPALLDEMRQDLAAYPLNREFVLLKRNWIYLAKGYELVYYFDDHQDIESKLQILENEELIQNITYNNVRRFIIMERLAQYLGAP